MGERAGYRVRQGKIVSPILRKQWYIGDDENLKELVLDIAKLLLDTPYGEPIINSGGVALRHDLDISRLTAALYRVLYKPPFDSVELTLDCDISDHGLYEIELKRWNLWIVNHYKVSFEGKRGKCERLFAVKFIPGRPLETGVEWLSLEELIAEVLVPVTATA